QPVFSHEKGWHSPPQPLETVQITNLGKSQAQRVNGLDRWVVRRLLNSVGKPPVSIKLWNGETFSASSSADLHVNILDRSTLYRFLVSPTLAFGEGYMNGKIIVEGSLVRLC